MKKFSVFACVLCPPPKWTLKQSFVGVSFIRAGPQGAEVRMGEERRASGPAEGCIIDLVTIMGKKLPDITRSSGRLHVL